MSFAMHEIIYFGRSIPWAIIDRISYFNKYKIQSVRALVSTYPVLEVLTTDNVASKKFQRHKNNGVALSWYSFLISPWSYLKYGMLYQFDSPCVWRLINFVRLFHPMAQYVGLATGVPFPSLLTMLYDPS